MMPSQVTQLFSGRGSGLDVIEKWTTLLYELEKDIKNTNVFTKKSRLLQKS